jgi:hypothetical protein
LIYNNNNVSNDELKIINCAKKFVLKVLQYKYYGKYLAKLKMDPFMTGKIVDAIPRVIRL